MAKIECAICKEQIHAVQTHLKNHPEWTMEMYKDKYPDAPLLSDEAAQKIKEHEQTKLNMAGSVTAIASARPMTSIKRPLNEVFGLGAAKAALSARGQPIMITTLGDAASDILREQIPTEDKRYIPDIDLLKNVIMGLELNMPVWLYGPAGVGKSSLPRYIAAKTHRPMLRVNHTINTEESHLVGQYVVENIIDPVSKELRTITRWQDGPLPYAMKHGLLYLADEMDRCPPGPLSVYQAVLEGEPLYIKEAPPEHRLVKPHANFRFVATGNTNGSGDETGIHQATLLQDAATIERFSLVLKVEYMPAEQEIAIMMAQAGLVEADAKRLRDFCEQIRKGHPNDFSLTIGPRVAINIGKIGIAKGSFMAGVALAFANRLPEVQREAALSIAQRVFASA